MVIPTIRRVDVPIFGAGSLLNSNRHRRFACHSSGITLRGGSAFRERTNEHVLALSGIAVPALTRPSAKVCDCQIMQRRENRRSRFADRASLIGSNTGRRLSLRVKQWGGGGGGGNKKKSVCRERYCSIAPHRLIAKLF